MRKILAFFIKIVAMVLVVLLVATFWPQVTGLIGGLLGGPGSGITVTTQLSHELREMGMLTSMQYTDTGVFVSSLPALVIGEAQRVTVPYAYTIDYGVNLEQAGIRQADDGLLSVSLPPVEIVHDALRVTGKVEVFDILFPLTETRYQQILDEQAEAFRQAYLDDPAYAEATLETARDKVRTLLESLLKAQGLHADWSIVFEEEPVSL